MAIYDISWRGCCRIFVGLFVLGCVFPAASLGDLGCGIPDGLGDQNWEPGTLLPTGLFPGTWPDCPDGYKHTWLYPDCNEFMTVTDGMIRGFGYPLAPDPGSAVVDAYEYMYFWHAAAGPYVGPPAGRLTRGWVAGQDVHSAYAGFVGYSNQWYKVGWAPPGHSRYKRLYTRQINNPLGDILPYWDHKHHGSGIAFWEGSAQHPQSWRDVMQHVWPPFSPASILLVDGMPQFPAQFPFGWVFFSNNPQWLGIEAEMPVVCNYCGFKTQEDPPYCGTKGLSLRNHALINWSSKYTLYYRVDLYVGLMSHHVGMIDSGSVGPAESDGFFRSPKRASLGDYGEGALCSDLVLRWWYGGPGRGPNDMNRNDPDDMSNFPDSFGHDSVGGSDYIETSDGDLIPLNWALGPDDLGDDFEQYLHDLWDPADGPNWPSGGGMDAPINPDDDRSDEESEELAQEAIDRLPPDLHIPQEIPGESLTVADIARGVSVGVGPSTDSIIRELERIRKSVDDIDISMDGIDVTVEGFGDGTMTIQEGEILVDFDVESLPSEMAQAVTDSTGDAAETATLLEQFGTWRGGAESDINTTFGGTLSGIADVINGWSESAPQMWVWIPAGSFNIRGYTWPESDAGVDLGNQHIEAFSNILRLMFTAIWACVPFGAALWALWDVFHA